MLAKGRPGPKVTHFDREHELVRARVRAFRRRQKEAKCARVGGPSSPNIFFQADGVLLPRQKTDLLGS